MKTALNLSIITAALTIAASAQASNLVTNGGFETGGNGLAFISGSYSGVGSNGVIAASSQIVGWTAFGGGSLGPDQYNGWSQNSADPTAPDNYQNSLPCSVVSVSCIPGDTLAPGAVQNDPNGGYFVTLDGDPNIYTGLEQTINGLKVGQDYTVKFDYGAVDRQQVTGPYTDSLVVALGGQSYTTPVLSEPSHGFSGWLSGKYTFKATSTSEVLSFLSEGTPAGLPPSAVLDGVSLTAGVPEPAAWAMMIVGVAGIGAMARRRRAAAMGVAMA